MIIIHLEVECLQICQFLSKALKQTRPFQLPCGPRVTNGAPRSV